MQGQTAANPLFGATETLSNSMRNAFRRMDMHEHRTRLALKTTGNKVMNEALARSQACVATPQHPPDWRATWLSNAPTVEELLLATHHAPSISAEELSRNIEERQVQRERREHRMHPALAAHRAAPAPPVVVLKQQPPSQPQPPLAPRPPTDLSPRAASAAAAATATSALAEAAPPSPTTASTLRPAPAPPPSSTRPSSARGRLQSSGYGGVIARRGADGGGSLSARGTASRAAGLSTTSALLGRKTVMSLFDSILRREDLHALMFDVKAAAREAAFQRTAEDEAAAQADETAAQADHRPPESHQTSSATQQQMHMHMHARPPPTLAVPSPTWEPGSSAAAVAAALAAARQAPAAAPAATPAATPAAAPVTAAVLRAGLYFEERPRSQPAVDGAVPSTLGASGLPASVAAAIAATSSNASAARPAPPSHRAPPTAPSVRQPPPQPSQPAKPLAQPSKGEAPSQPHWISSFQQRTVAPVHRTAPSHRRAPSPRAIGQPYAAAPAADPAPGRIYRMPMRTAVRAPPPRQRPTDPLLIGLATSATLNAHPSQPPPPREPALPPTSQPPSPTCSPESKAVALLLSVSETVAPDMAPVEARPPRSALQGGRAAAAGTSHRIPTPQRRRSVTFADETLASHGLAIAEIAEMRPPSPQGTPTYGLTFAASHLDASLAVAQQQHQQQQTQQQQPLQPGAVSARAVDRYHGGGRWAELGGAGELQPHVCMVPLSFVQGQRAPPPKPMAHALANTEERSALAMVRNQQGAS